MSYSGLNKNVFDKLPKQEVELSKMEVELGSVQELKQASMGIYTSIQDARAGLDKASKDYRLLEVKFQKEFEAAMKVAKDKLSEFEKAASKLGLDPNSVDMYKSLKLNINVAPKDYSQMQQGFRK